MASIFTHIVQGEIPCHKLYEDAHTLAFLDINPVSHGHCLVISKQEYATLEEAPDEVAAAVMAAVKRVGAAVKATLGADAYNVLLNNGSAAGQEVPHLHVHIIPRYTGDGVRFGWKPGKLRDPQQTVLTIRSALEP